jgi:hypothetical protein
MCECESKTDDIFVSADELAVFDEEYGSHLYYKIKFCPFCGEKVEKRKSGQDERKL